jgi:hypothetical protein
MKIKQKESLQISKDNIPGDDADAKEQSKINNLLMDIENEFRELDDLMKEVDDVS